MRNLLEYPITAEEVILVIDQIPHTYEECGIGDLRPCIRRGLLEFFKKNPDTMDALLADMR